MMVIHLLAALVVAFLTAKLFGKRFIPWLEKHNIRQYAKDEVEHKIYLTGANDAVND